MCLIVFDYQPHSEQPFRLAANRDEFYRRPSQSAHRWKDAPMVLAGKDLEMGGTWMGISESGQFAAVTNYREMSATSTAHSRGRLTADFLIGEQSAKSYLTSLALRADEFAGFNLILGDSQGLYYFSNREGLVRKLNAGLYGLSNHLLNTPWPKLQKAKRALINAFGHAQLQTLLADQLQPDDKDLPNTGIGIEWERLLGSCFIQSEQYGTRTCSSLIIQSSGQASLQERHFGRLGEPLETNHQQIDFTNPWRHEGYTHTP